MLLTRGAARSVLPACRLFASNASEARDLFEELEGYDDEQAGPVKVESITRSVSKPGDVKEVTSRMKGLKGSGMRYNKIARWLRGKPYPMAVQALSQINNMGAKRVLTIMENARKTAHHRWEVPDDSRLKVREAWTGKGKYLRMMRYHARGRTGIKHKQYSHFTLILKYFSPEDDDHLFKRMEAALQRRGIEPHKARYTARYGSRKLINMIGKETGLKRVEVRQYLRDLSQIKPEYKRKPFNKRNKD